MPTAATRLQGAPHSGCKQRWPRVVAAWAVAIFLIGCGGRGQQARPVMRPATTAPATLPTTQSADEATQPSTGPTQPASEPATLPATQPATAPATDPTTEPATQAAPAPAREPRLLPIEQPTPASAALADLFAGFAARALEQEGADLLHAQAATVLEAAVRLAPRDDRLARELVDVRLRLGDLTAALEALEHYRRLRPDDLLAQIRYVDLSAAEMELADAKLEYLIRVAQTEGVPPEVRSHAAATASLLLREALDEQGADVLLEQAVGLDPYSPQALQMFYERLLETGEPRARRVDALALLARSNVLQPAVLSALADELAEAGLAEEANDIYQRAVQLYRALGVAPPTEMLLDGAALQVVADRPDAARQTIAAALAAHAAADAEMQSAQTASVADLHLVELLARQRFAEPGGEQMQQAIQATANTLRFMLAQLRASLHEQPAPATNPDGAAPQTPLPDVLADAKLLADESLAPKHVALRLHYAALLSNLAWLDLYFRAQPAEGAVLEALAILVPEESVTLRRLRGWQLWRQGQAEAARAALQEIAVEDPLARLATVLIDAQAGSEIKESAQELMNSRRAGLVGAFLSDSLRAHGVGVQPAEDAPQAREALATLPTALFGLMEPANVRNFYSLSAEPRSVRHEYGEPILMTVTLRNSGRHTITVGPEGVVQPVIRLDALVRGQLEQEQPVPAASAAELWGSVRLDPGEKIEQTVRLDGPVLSALLASKPELSLTVDSDVTTNPALVQTDQGLQHVTAPGGQTQRGRRLITRTGFPINPSDPELASAIDQRLELLRSGQPLQRLRTAQWALAQQQWLLGLIAQRKQAGAQQAELASLQDLANRINDALQRAALSLSLAGPDAPANAWLKYTAAVAAPQARERLIGQLLAANSFEARITGLLAVSVLSDLEAAERLVAPMAGNDPDPTVRRFAAELMEFARQRPSTGAASQPVTPMPTPATSPGTQPEALPQ